jgi:hypothetical protein
MKKKGILFGNVSGSKHPDPITGIKELYKELGRKVIEILVTSQRV